jgi:hypothetical protein
MVHETLAAVLEAGIRGFSVYGRLKAEDFPFATATNEAEVVRYPVRHIYFLGSFV